MAHKPITLDHIPDEHLRGIGLVALSWSFLEGAVERIIWRLSRLNDMRGRGLTTHMNLPQRLDAVTSLAVEEFPDAAQTKRLKQIAKHIRKNLAPKRNTIVHSRVIQFDQAEFALRVKYKARGKIEKSADPIDLQEYEDVSKEILTIAGELRGMISDYIGLIEKKDGAPPP